MSRPALPFVRDRHFAFDVVLCAVVSPTAALPLLSPDRNDVVAVFFALLVTVPLMLRRLLPRIAFAVMLAGALGTVAVDQQVSAPGLIAVPIMVYTLARWNEQSLARLGLLAAGLGSVLGPARWTLSSGVRVSNLSLFGVAVVACVAVVTGAYVLGRRRRESLANAAQQQRAQAERSRLLQAEQAQRDRAATVDERNRIARDLHDIVAHSLSVIVVQAEGGKALTTKSPEQAPEVLGTIAETSRQALAEMRQMVGLLRGGPVPSGADYLPAPGLTDIPELVRRTSRHAELVTTGPPPPVPPALGLSAYRLVQESLTNVLKHAGPAARARVSLAYTATSIEIEVVDDGRGAAAGDGRGHGLHGMAERVALHRGQLSAYPLPGGGWTVRARLPLPLPAAGPPRPAGVW